MKAKGRTGAMPLYTFELREGAAPLSDLMGVELPDRERALAYAKEVVRELMQAREGQTRTWRFDVYEDRDERVFELPFAALDHTLDNFAPEFRSVLERHCNLRRSVLEAVHAAGVTIRESRALVAQSRGKPYLAAIAGKQTIR